jgi:prevent-host-death family protein
VDEANARGEVRVTHHNRTEVVVLSVSRYEQLKRRAEGRDALATLRAEFDRELEVFRTAGAADRIETAFHATPEEFAAAANAAAARRRK